MIPAFMAAWALRKPDNVLHDYVGVSSTPVKKKKNKQRVLKAKGGGSPPAPNPMKEAQAQAWLEQERAARTATEEANRVAREKAEQEELRARAAPKIESAYQGARSYGTGQSAGYDPGLLTKYGVLPSYEANLQTQRAGIEDTDVTPTFNAESAWQDVLGGATSRYRGDLSRAIGGFAGDDFQNQLIKDTMDDQILNSILTRQEDEAEQQIMSAYQGGKLSDVGFSKAMTELDTARKAGMGQLQNIGGGVLSGYRDLLTGMKTNALNKVSGLTLADTYDPASFNKALQQSVATSTGGLEGDILNAIGDQRFFDPTKIISLAGAQQGFFNPSRPAPTTTGAAIPGGGAESQLLTVFADNEKNRAAPTSKVF